MKDVAYRFFIAHPDGAGWHVYYELCLCLAGIYFRFFHGVLPKEKTEIDTAAPRKLQANLHSSRLFPIFENMEQQDKKSVDRNRTIRYVSSLVFVAVLALLAYVFK